MKKNLKLKQKNAIIVEKYVDLILKDKKNIVNEKELNKLLLQKVSKNKIT